ncbi:MAG: tRNA (adenosine(37)-N6)-dimethylallyltransferase MiaA [Desulfobacteraceae bacterium]|nr:tRNA (adenosine(37)-N6)-dimethylallyltransferase MiaA [Desulfobacteraceae bacterium]
MTQPEKPKVIVICGPTGIGKTEVSLSLAEAFNGCIISADSMQIYRHMDIGTAKPDDGERSRVSHYMMDVADPDEPYDAARFSAEGRRAIDQIRALHKVPFVVGGTGFYIRALLHGLFDARSVDPAITRRLERTAEADGIQALHGRLAACDPAAAVHIHPNDAYRIIRALAVFETSGLPASAIQKAHGFNEHPFDSLRICLNMDRAALYGRINRRVDAMVAGGLLDEVKHLLEMGYAADLRPMQAIGYRHMTDFIEGRVNWEDSISLLKRDTRRFAKRQLTWFRREPDMIWVDIEEKETISELIGGFLHPRIF